MPTPHTRIQAYRPICTARLEIPRQTAIKTPLLPYFGPVATSCPSFSGTGQGWIKRKGGGGGSVDDVQFTKNRVDQNPLERTTGWVGAILQWQGWM